MLYVADTARAVAWYRDHFGFEPVYESPHYASVRHPGIGLSLGLHPVAQGASVEHGDAAQVYFGVRDMDAAVAKLRGAGIVVDDPRSEGGSLRFAGFADPDGNSLGLQEIA